MKTLLIFFVLSALAPFNRVLSAADGKLAAQSPEKGFFYTSGGIRMSFLFSAPKNKNGKLFILLHGLGSDKGEWQALLNALSENGNGFFAYDARGHGESTVNKAGLNISYQHFSRQDWGKLLTDLSEAAAFVTEKKLIPSEKIGVIGASLGANIALIFCSNSPNIGPAILLSPGLNYAGYETTAAINAFSRRPVLIAASPDDSYAFESCLFLNAKIKANKNAFFLKGKSGHGVQMFDGYFEKEIIKFINKYN